MFESWPEFCTFIYITPFEVLMHLVALLVSSGLFFANAMQWVSLSWWSVAAPLFVQDLADTYFCIIVFIRQLHCTTFRTAFLRAFFSFKRILLLLGFKLLLCHRLEGKLLVNYSEVCLPLLYCLFMLICRSFRLTG